MSRERASKAATVIGLEWMCWALCKWCGAEDKANEVWMCRRKSCLAHRSVHSRSGRRWYDQVSGPSSPRKTTCLNPSDQDASVLGKRVHDGSPQMLEDDITPGPIEEDEDEDDVGPRPVPADPSSVGGARKKRKGSFVAVNRCEVAYQDPLVLPHEKL